MAFLVERVRDPDGDSYPDYHEHEGRYRDGYVSAASNSTAAIRDYARRVMGSDTYLAKGDRFLVRELGPEQFIEVDNARMSFQTKQVEDAWS